MSSKVSSNNGFRVADSQLNIVVRETPLASASSSTLNPAFSRNVRSRTANLPPYVLVSTAFRALGLIRRFIGFFIAHVKGFWGKG